jgi:stage II sporulation protein Q
MEEQKNPKQPIPFKKGSAWKSFLGKKWAFPAIYVGSAAIILALVMWYQNSAISPTVDKEDILQGVTQTGDAQDAAADAEQDAMPVNRPAQPMAWPVGEEVAYQIGKDFFDDNASKEEQQEALVQFDGAFHPHKGIDIIPTNGQPFDVTAALDGKVVRVENDPLVGRLVEIEHPDNLVTVYQSLESVSVKPGDEVKQGQVIGKAGRNDFEKDAGPHLHFEVRADGKAVDPEQYLNQTDTQSQ